MNVLQYLKITQENREIKIPWKFHAAKISCFNANFHWAKWPAILREIASKIISPQNYNFGLLKVNNRNTRPKFEICSNKCLLGVIKTKAIEPET